MFDSFGLKPALGRLLSEADEQAPGAHPHAVLSFDYWTRRFGQDPHAVGRSFRMGETLYEIIGVADKRFTGTEPGTFVDIFVPAMMNPYVTRSDASVFRVFAQLNSGAPVEPVRAMLQANSRAFEEERAKGFVGVPKQSLENFLSQKLVMEPAPTGVSDIQSDNRRSLAALGVLVALVLLIACANVANLMTGQAAARSHEMALRISIGAGRWRLAQLVLIESAWIALLAAAIGAFFAWCSAPFVVSRINPPDNPVRLRLPPDWRVDRKSTRLNSSHVEISYAVFCLKKKKNCISSVRPPNYEVKLLYVSTRSSHDRYLPTLTLSHHSQSSHDIS